MRLIDADALKQMIDFRMWDVDDDYPHDEASNRISEDHAVKKIIDEMPTVDAEPVKHGKWIWKGEEGDSRFMCSVCKLKEDVPTCNGVPDIWQYCPNCGARMDGERKEE